MKWKYHAKQLGLDLLAGVAVYLTPLVSTEDFPWTTQWWLIVLGGVARRVVAVIVRYATRATGDRTPLE